MIANPATFCTLSGFVKTMAGDELENAIVRVRIIEGVDAISGDSAISSAPAVTYTDDDGAFEFILPRGALARIEIPESGLDAFFNVPNIATATLAELQLEEYAP